MIKCFFVIIVFGIPLMSWSYPELLTHSYSSCTACHISPSGGGVLTDYGKSLAAEVLSYQKSETVDKNKLSPEEKAALSTWLLGGDARGLFFIKNNKFEKSSHIIPMQAQAEVAYNQETWAAVGRVGIVDKEADSLFNLIPTAYGLYRFNDEWAIRAGRFLPNYGLNTSLHFTSPRGPLGFGFDDQRPAAELSYISEAWSAFFTATGKRGPSDLGNNSFSTQFQWGPTEKSRVAINFWNETNQRTIVGSWFILPFGDSFYFLGDYNQQVELKKYTGYYRYSKLGYQLRQGINLYLMHDQSMSDKNLSYTLQSKFGPGFQVFLENHYEIDAAFLKETINLYNQKQGNYAYILLHYYL